MPHLALPLLLLAIASSTSLTQPPADRPPPARPQSDRPAENGPRPIDADKDEVLLKLKSALEPTPEQWKSIQDLYSKFRTTQRTTMREIRRSVLGDAGGPPANGERPAPPTAEQRAVMDKLVAEKIDPINKAFLKDLRDSLTESQRSKFDEAAKSLDLATPRRPQGGPGGPGGGPPANSFKGPLPPPQLTIEVKDGFRIITSNGIPDHKTGQFPGRGNPNTIAPQSYTFRVTTTPKANDKPSPHRSMLAGVALNGVVFDPGTAEFWKNDPSTGWRQEAISPKTIAGDKMGLDSSNAHVQPNGAYHYHAAPEGLIEGICKAKGVKDGEAMIQIGWSADGFPIYDHHCYSKVDDPKSTIKQLRSSYKLKRGNRPDGKYGPGGTFDGTYTNDFEYVKGSGDLDECNGRFGVTPEFPEGTYYYVITGEFPFISRMFRGTPDPSFGKHNGPPPGEGRPGDGGPGGGGRGGRPDGPPPGH